MKIQIFEVIKQGINLSFKNKTILSLIVLLPIILGILIFILREVVYLLTLPDFGIILLALFYLIVLYFICWTITKVAFENLNEKKISISAATLFTLKRFIPLFIATIIYFIIVFIGSIALIIPGVFLIIILFFYDYAILLNNKGIIASFKESCNIVEGNRWRVFALLLIFIIVSILVGALSRLLALVLPLYLIDIILMSIFYFILGIATVISTIVYFQLIEKEKIRDDTIVKSTEIVK